MLTGAGLLEVVRAGALTTVQDEGRPGLAHLAVPPSGAADRRSHRLANRLVGNPEGAATLETTVDGVSLRCDVDRHVAVTGAVAPITLDGREVGWCLPVLLRAGQLLDVGTAAAGVRCYVAVAGGIAVGQVLGSRSTDLLSGLGPPPLSAGDRLPLGATSGAPAPMDAAPYAAPAGALRIELVLGPRDDWLGRQAVELLGSALWRVSPASNRIAVRLEGPPLDLTTSAQLPSEGMVTGAVQFPPGGHPLVFLADHPTTGGYPVVAVAGFEGICQLAQARPGTPISFGLHLPSWGVPSRGAEGGGVPSRGAEGG
ncbi:MAG: biotin-dependent carboxyltransferase family protein [Acidimicrobiales bacterium]